MDGEGFRKHGKDMVDFIVDYVNSNKDRPVAPQVQPGYMKSLMPSEAPENGESFDDIMKDIEPVILSGVTNWHHPNFHAYYAAGRSYPSILGDMLSDAIGCLGFSWIASPACTELEMIVMDWLAKALSLPEHFLFSSAGKGGGVIHGAASEATLVVFLAARNDAVDKLKQKTPGIEPCEALGKLIAYTSDQAHSSVERAAMLAFVRVRKVGTDGKRSLRGAALLEAIEKDKANGLVPMLCVATMGTTNSCGFDNLEELGPICNQEGIWFHVDAAYAGGALICPEFQFLGRGLESSDSFNFNPHKWLQVNFDCSALWLKDSSKLVDAFSVEPLYLKHDFTGGLPDYRHWQIPFGRRFRSLKLWFVLRNFGLNGLRELIRKHVKLAHEFEELLNRDERFEIVEEVVLGLVCFRLKGDNEKTRKLNKLIRDDNRLHMGPGSFEDSDTYFLRLAICSADSESMDMQFAYSVVDELTGRLM